MGKVLKELDILNAERSEDKAFLSTLYICNDQVFLVFEIDSIL